MPANIPIKQLPNQDRPREKLLSLGPKNLTDSELLAILINTGTKEHSAIELARRLLQEAENRLGTLAKMDLSQLMKQPGIGEAKAITLLVAFELGRRRLSDNSEEERKKISSSQDAFDVLRPLLLGLKHEEMHCIFLNRGGFVIKTMKIGEGTQHQTLVDPRKIVKLALDFEASALILGHNHPSGALTPSKSDLTLTEKVAKCAEVFDLSLHDHLIVNDSGSYTSFADKGLMK